MAQKKSRTPPPPKTSGGRPVQAPKVRTEPRVRRAGLGRNTRLWLIGTGAAVVVVVVVIVLATVLGGGSDASALAAAGCVQQTYPSQGRKHVQELPEGFEYNSFPATSGQHHPQPALWNVYTEPIDQIHTVHNLEHGGIAVQYGDEVPEATVGQIRQWYESGDRTGILVAPLPELGDKVALTAWTVLATCPGFDAKAADAFVDLHRYKGPERLPIDAMLPGS